MLSPVFNKVISLLTFETTSRILMDMTKINQKQINRENLLNHGVELLKQQGYHGTGLQEILDEVKIPKGSFYNYFASKEEFAAEIISHYIKPFILRLSDYLNEPCSDALSAMRRYFEGLIAELEQADFKGGCLLGNLMGEVGDTSEICRISLQNALNSYRDVMVAGLVKAQQEGTIRTDQTALEMADLLLDAWQGALLRMKIERSCMPLRRCCDHLLGDLFKP